MEHKALSRRSKSSSSRQTSPALSKKPSSFSEEKAPPTLNSDVSTGSSSQLSSSNAESSNLLSKTNQNASLGSTANPIEAGKKYKDTEIGINLPSTEVQQGKFTDSRRDRPTRMLDRFSRVALTQLPEKKRTPHLATTILDGKIHIAGNSGKRRVSSEHTDEVEEQMRNPAKLKSENEHKNEHRMEKDLSKLSALSAGKYDSQDENGKLTEIKGGIETKSIEWHQLDKGGKGSKHGEMALHKPILKHARNNQQDKNKKISIPIAGVKKDCILCHWTHDILNEYVYADLGHQVTTSGTHGDPFPGWIAPQELLDHEEARKAFEKKLKTLNTGGEKWSMDKDGKVTASGNPKLTGNSHDSYESDSECESDSE